MALLKTATFHHLRGPHRPAPYTEVNPLDPGSLPYLEGAFPVFFGPWDALVGSPVFFGVLFNGKIHLFKTCQNTVDCGSWDVIVDGPEKFFGFQKLGF